MVSSLSGKGVSVCYLVGNLTIILCVRHGNRNMAGRSARDANHKSHVSCQVFGRHSENGRSLQGNFKEGYDKIRFLCK